MTQPLSRRPSRCFCKTRVVPRLTLLNGTPAIGKSTLARRYVDTHPGVLRLDIDEIAQLIGGWQDQRGQTVALARSMALDMARHHLRAGGDVIAPQFVGRVDELQRFEGAAAQSGSRFLHVVLMDNGDGAAARFTERGRTATSPWLRSIHKEVTRNGGEHEVRAMHGRLADVVRSRLTSVLVPSVAGDPEQTYARLLAALDKDPAPPTLLTQSQAGLPLPAGRGTKPGRHPAR